MVLMMKDLFFGFFRGIRRNFPVGFMMADFFWGDLLGGFGFGFYYGFVGIVMMGLDFYVEREGFLKILRFFNFYVFSFYLKKDRFLWVLLISFITFFWAYWRRFCRGYSRLNWGDKCLGTDKGLIENGEFDGLVGVDGLGRIDRCEFCRENILRKIEIMDRKLDFIISRFCSSESFSNKLDGLKTQVDLFGSSDEIEYKKCNGVSDRGYIYLNNVLNDSTYVEAIADVKRNLSENVGENENTGNDQIENNGDDSEGNVKNKNECFRDLFNDMFIKDVEFESPTE